MLFKKNKNNTNKDHLSTLIEASQKGDKAQYRKFLNEISPLITSYLKKRLSNDEDIQDVTQITLMAIHSSLHTYQSGQAVENWIYGITKYKFLDHLRKFYKKNENEVSNQEHIETFLADETNNNIVGIKHDLEKIMENLPEKQQKIIRLLKIQGHSVAEVAAKMDMSENNVKVTAHRAMKDLQTIAQSLEEKEVN